MDHNNGKLGGYALRATNWKDATTEAAILEANIKASHKSSCREAANSGEAYPYCIHGSFIGYPSGADYICGYCEDGLRSLEVSKVLYLAIGDDVIDYSIDKPNYWQIVKDNCDNATIGFVFVACWTRRQIAR